MDLNVAHQESIFEERVSSYGADTHIDDDVGIDVVDFMQHIDIKHHGQHVADEMRTTSWT